MTTGEGSLTLTRQLVAPISSVAAAMMAILIVPA
jgi:hypothetical protein